jgi:hypothetical protein
MFDRNRRIGLDLALIDASTGSRIRELDAGEKSGLAYLSDAQLEILLHQARSLTPPGLSAETQTSAAGPLPYSRSFGERRRRGVVRP